MPDDDDREWDRERKRDQLSASDGQYSPHMRELWLKVGFDITNPLEIKDIKDALAWAVRSEKRAATFGTRLMVWITFVVGLVGGIFGILKYLQDWRGH